MMKIELSSGSKTEEVQAELAATACALTGRQNGKGAFIDVELDLWQALGARLRWSCPLPSPGREAC